MQISEIKKIDFKTAIQSFESGGFFGVGRLTANNQYFDLGLTRFKYLQIIKKKKLNLSFLFALCRMGTILSIVREITHIIHLFRIKSGMYWYKRSNQEIK